MKAENQPDYNQVDNWGSDPQYLSARIARDRTLQYYPIAAAPKNKGTKDQFLGGSCKNPPRKTTSDPTPTLEDMGVGKKGGLSEYARQVGKARQNLGKYQEAATVVKNLNLNNVMQVLDKAKQLAENPDREINQGKRTDLIEHHNHNNEVERVRQGSDPQYLAARIARSQI